MKHTLCRWLLCLAAGFIFGCSDPSTPKEGEQFRTLSANLTTYSFAPVSEVFSLTCGHCRQMESVLPELEVALQQDIAKVHVTFNQSADTSAAFYYSAVVQLGHTPDATMMDALFTAVQQASSGDGAAQKAAIEVIFREQGLTSPYTLNGEQQRLVHAELSRARAITEQGQIDAVPTFIINGRYQVLTEGHDNVKQMANTISYLLHQHSSTTKG